MKKLLLVFSILAIIAILGGCSKHENDRDNLDNGLDYEITYTTGDGSDQA